jgi:ribosome-binding protein aMBF1 (putative translation factor)
MSKKFIPATKLFDEWRKDPEYIKEFNALEEEFARAQMIIGARVHADLSQAELAERMGTSQSAIARLESGRVKPSTRTLEKLAAATGMKLRIVLEPVGAASA